MKKKYKTLIIFVLIVIVFSTICSTAVIAKIKADKSASNDIIYNISPTQKGSVCVDNEYVSDLYANFTDNYSLKFAGSDENLAMESVTLTWACDNANYYQIYLDTTPKFTSAEKKLTFVPSATFDNLYPNTNYYWKVDVIDNNGQKKTSKVYTFFAQGNVRSVAIDGVSNVRDLGGKQTLSGKRIAYSLVYRSACLDNISKEGKLQVLKLGIKTDLDLRGNIFTVSPAGQSINIICQNAPYYAGDTTGIKPLDGDATNAAYIEALKNEIKVFADIQNYPIIFHCQVGRDRTGTLAVLLQGICGVSIEDIKKDYELSYLSVSGFLDGSAYPLTAMRNMISYLQTFEGNTFQEQVINYCKMIGVTQSEIESIQNILLVE